jgi:uncharacterized protein
MTSELPSLSVRTLRSVDDLGRERWDALAVGRGAVPFVHHGFLSALEEAGCLAPRTGWASTHLAVEGEGGALLGIAPTFAKTHSMGEFVYDWAWADASERLGVAYYPKLVIAAPFSPVSGQRLLVAPHLSGNGAREVKRALLLAAVAHAQELGCAGVHVLFCDEDEVALARELGFTHRLGCQFHWDNAGYADFAAFLARFDSKRRNQIRRERRRVREQGVEIHSYAGDAVPDALAGPAFEFYQATVRRFAWGRRYLNQRFFDLLWQRMRPYLQLMIATRGEAVVGGSLNLESRPVGSEAAAGVTRFGRYWGALAEIDCLHFEICAYAAIEDCIRRGVRGFEAGAGGEDHKLGRGFLPHRTHSLHLLFEPRLHHAISEYCRREAHHIEQAIARAQVFVR